MSTYATLDDLNELTTLVKGLLGNIDTLSNTCGDIVTNMENTDHILDMKDVTITYLTEGDLLQYDADGTWHNVLPWTLDISVDGTGEIAINDTVVKSMIKTEGSKLFLSKLYDDIAKGKITFNQGFNSNGISKINDTLQFGNYITGIFTGTGGLIDKDGRAELTSLTLREFLEVPELRFNRVDVVSGELWNSICFGTIESVDTKNLIVTLKLEEGEYSGIHVNDICRGIFHNLGTNNDTDEGVDENGFSRIPGFSTSYFTPTEVLDSYGKKFRYALKSGTSQHPSKAMKFVVYGNFTDPSRRSSSYITKSYTRYLKNVATWGINYTNIASQFGNIDGLNIPGAPNDGMLEGDGAYLTNVYMTGAMIEFTPEQYDALKGLDAYQVSLDRETGIIFVDNDLEVVGDYTTTKDLTYKIQAWKGKTELQYSEIMEEGMYFAEINAVGVKCTFDSGTIKVTEITNINDMHIDISVNCEGNLIANKKIVISYALEANSLWITYNDNDSLPSVPTGDGNTGGWHRNFTSTAIWMSTKSSRKLNEGIWGDPVRFVGASVAGKDGQYTAFCYTNSSGKPSTPVSNQIPPVDSNYTWTSYPIERPNKTVFTWMTQATVYSDKTMSGWSIPTRITGETGEDGTDGTTFEFIYKLTTGITVVPDKPASAQVDDDIPFGWSDNPQGVSKENMVEWICTRSKGTDGIWTEYSTPVIWSKWGEKGMDGDGYEYIFTRTADTNIIPLTPFSKLEIDYLPTIANGGSKDYNWSDNPKGVDSNLKAEWVCKRQRRDNVWGDFSTPSLWSNWGETGAAGGNYQYRWKISATKPTTTPDNDNTWVMSYDDNTTPEEGTYVWLIQRFKNSDGSYTAWGNIIRLTGANGKDGEDGNSIEFIYARNADGAQPETPTGIDESDFLPTIANGHGKGLDWFDNPQGVTNSLMYEWVSLRMLNKTTQTWGEYSTPGLWARYSERGKDGDGFEYIYKLFATYQDASAVSVGGIYYPSTSSSNYQLDDYVPDGYTDNPVGPDGNPNIYEYVWTRKKHLSVWGNWTNGALWSKWSKDGEDGSDGYVLDLTNDSSTVNCDLYGNILSTIQSTTVNVYKGSNLDTSNWVFTISNSDGATCQLIDNVLNITNITKDVTGIEISASKIGFITRKIVYTITKAYAGTNGLSAKSYWIIPSVSVIKKNSSGTLTPTTLTVTKMKQTGNLAASATSEGYVSYLTSSGDTGSAESSISINSAWTYIDLLYTVDMVLVDKERIPIISDGLNGANGEDGSDGQPGQPGQPGVTITVSGAPSVFKYSLGFINPNSVTLRAVSTSSIGISSNYYGYWAAYKISSGTYTLINSYSGSPSATFNITTDGNVDSYWFGFSTSQIPTKDTANIWSTVVQVISDPDVSGLIDLYTLLRDRGIWSSSKRYYKDYANIAMAGSTVSNIESYYKIASTESVVTNTDADWTTGSITKLKSGYNIYSFLKTTYSSGEIFNSEPYIIGTISSSYSDDWLSLRRCYFTPYYLASSSKDSASINLLPLSYFSTSIQLINSTSVYGWMKIGYEIKTSSSSSADVSGISSSNCTYRFLEDYKQYENWEKLTVIDYVQHKGNVYLATSTNVGNTPSLTSSYWLVSSKQEFLSVNNLLANNAKLGEFNFSNTTFTSSNGKLSMNSSTGLFKCDNAIVSGDITTNKLIANNSSGIKISSMNENGDGSYILFYTSGNKRMEFNSGNITYYNDDTENTVKWILGEAGEIIKTNLYYWSDTISRYNGFLNTSINLPISGYLELRSTSFDTAFTTMDYKNVVSSYKSSYRTLTALTGTYAEYNGICSTSAGPNTIPSSSLTLLPDGIYMYLSGLENAIITPDVPTEGDGSTWWARSFIKVVNSKVECLFQILWKGTPSSYQTTPEDRRVFVY